MQSTVGVRAAVGDGAQDAILLVALGGRRYGLPLAAVERVLPMAYVLPVPDSGQGLLGMLNLHGDVLPVMDPRRRLGMGTPKVSVDHRLVLLASGRGERFLLWVDAVEEVTQGELTEVPGRESNPLVPRVLRLEDEMVPVLAPAALEPRTGLAR